jgi:hypothetical protein
MGYIILWELWKKPSVPFLDLIRKRIITMEQSFEKSINILRSGGIGKKIFVGIRK